MVLVYIKNKALLTKIITYLDISNIRYTTNLKDEYKYAIVSSIDRITIDIINNTKTFYIAYLDEEKMYKNRFKKYGILNRCYKIIVSIEYFKKYLKQFINKQIIVIHKEIPIINCKNKFKIEKKIIILDSEYKNISLMNELGNSFNYKFYYLGYNKLSKKDKIIYNTMPNNIVKIKYYDYDLFESIIRDSFMVINMNDTIDIKYIQIPILLKKNMILKDINYYDNYLIPCKEMYYYSSSKDLINKLNKIKNRRLSNLTNEAFDKISKDNCKTTAYKYSLILK